MKEICQKGNPQIIFSTLGCRVNQYETQAIREQFLSKNFRETDKVEKADVVVLNTCTVTAESDKESRYLIRRFHRLNPTAKIIVTGCYAEKNKNEIESLPGVVLTAGNQAKENLAARFLDRSVLCDSQNKDQVFPGLVISDFEDKTRACLKIQDGCNHACSFCKVVLVRGRSKSRPIAEIVEEAERLTRQGISEIVLTGIQLGAFGYDLGKRQMLTDVLQELNCLKGLKRIRLSSIEPTDVTEDLIRVMALTKKVCPHLHIPLQSGDDGILKRMNRRYSSEFFIDLVKKLRAQIPDFVLTTDVMIRFPGEDENAFQNTVAVLRETQPYKLHIFPYSPREGTKAAKLSDISDGKTVRRRKQILLELEAKLKKNMMKEYLGKRANLLVERSSLGRGWSEGRMANYIHVRFRDVHPKPGFFKFIQIQKIENGDLLGEIIKSKEVAK